jgi:hypothetical protein
LTCRDGSADTVGMKRVGIGATVPPELRAQVNYQRELDSITWDELIEMLLLQYLTDAAESGPGKAHCQRRGHGSGGARRTEGARNE